MSRTVKIVLGISAVLLLACCGIGAAITFFVPTVIERVAEESFTESPEEAAAIGQELLTYRLPTGYEEMMAMDLGFQMVMIGPPEESNNNMVIMLMGFPSAFIDEEEMRQQMQQSANDQMGGTIVNAESVETEEIIINGETVTLTTLIGTDEEGNKLRQATAPFITKDGGAGMLMIMGVDDNWDADAAGTFLNSLR